MIDDTVPRALSHLALLLSTALGLAACGGDASGAGGGNLRIAYVTNGVDPFWDVAAAGARAAEVEFGVDVEVVFPSPDTVEVQQQKVQDLMVRGIDGLAISPIDATNMTPFLDGLSERVKWLTHDSDAPDSKRLCFIGVDNYLAGRECGELLRRALPDGGEVAIFVGRLEQDNARLRRQGVIDALLGRSVDSTRSDPVDGELTGGGFTIVATRTDGFDNARAKANAEDTLIKHPDLVGMAGLFAYNAPACLEALRGSGRLGKVALASFDEQEATLDGIADGHILGTVSQHPFLYGYVSVRILAALCRGDESALPDGGVLSTPPTVVTQENLGPFREKLEADMAAGSGE
ncbi:MAG: sugar-binding protein [Planctomycetota bacterium]